jgi:hypothetical protein
MIGLLGICANQAVQACRTRERNRGKPQRQHQPGADDLPGDPRPPGLKSIQHGEGIKQNRLGSSKENFCKAKPRTLLPEDVFP